MLRLPPLSQTASGARGKNGRRLRGRERLGSSLQPTGLTLAHTGQVLRVGMCAHGSRLTAHADCSMKLVTKRKINERDTGPWKCYCCLPGALCSGKAKPSRA